MLLKHLGSYIVWAAHDVEEDVAGLVEDGEPEIDRLKRGFFAGVREEEVLRLEVSVHHAGGMAGLDDADDGPDEPGGLALAVVSLLDDPVEELPAGAQLHHKVDEQRVLVGAHDGDDVGVVPEVAHYLHLPPDVLVILRADELPLGNGLAGELLASDLVDAEVGGAELSLT
uniref:Uncharacterized protein n=1 Tax=Nymphaea colorata TaxID=210225 RepID=A0A5K0Z1X1_9MAGN